jgi:DNA gyrase/topoisomerase IV subunit B
MRDEAELTGITKTSYKDELFAKDFDKNLRRLFDERGPEFFPTIAKLLSDDILLRYAQFYDTPMKKSEGRKIFADLHFFRNFFECKSPDRQKCELCIVEGTSAGNVVKARNNEFQAVYETKGKPYNPATFLHDITTNRKRLMQDKIYQDISRIINVGLNSTDMSTSNYGKIIIMSDADPDGYHIAALHVNNLYLLNPRLIESGMVWVAKPPLYAMELSKKRYMFLRDKHALYDARIEFIYEPALEISVQTHKGIYPATKDLYREIIYMVKETGEQIEAVAKQLDIPLLIIERLLYGIEFLFPKVRIHDVSSCFKSSDLPGHVRVIERDDDVLIVVIGDRNYVIGLQQIGATLIRYLGPLLKKYRLNEVTYLIRTKGKGSIYESKPQPMTAMMLYSCLQVLDEKLPLKVHRYKGLGQMPTECCFSTLMNPDTRSITQIKSIGDIKENYSLIGTDTTGRKDLLRSSVALSSSFLREQALLF